MPRPTSKSGGADGAAKAKEVVREYVQRCRSGDQVDSNQIITAHPELMPELGQELRKLEIITRARQQAESHASANDPNAQTDSRPGKPPEGPPPDSFPGYEIVRRIQRGGQGVVYQAIQKATKREVAIKVMREGRFAGPHDRGRFEREIEILGSLNHPHIVTIHDTGSSDGHFYFVMDYISGQPLDVYIAGRKPSIKETLRLFEQICSAVNAAHLRGVIHRDLKPSNIRIDTEGKPYILDFGLAKIASDSTNARAQQTMTVAGQFVGSLPWAAPEQVDGHPGGIDLRTDVYSLGVILYQMLTGRFPYDVVGSIRAVMDNIIGSEPIRPSSIHRRINDEVETIILKALNKSQERRYQSAGELARDVDRYLRGEPIEAKRDSTWYLLKKTVRRHKVPAAVVAAFVVLVAGFAVAMSIMYRRANQEAATARRVQTVLQSMFTELAPGTNASQITLKDVLDQGAERVAQELADEPAAQVEVMEAIADRYQILGAAHNAVALRERALLLRRSELGSEETVIADRLTRLADAYFTIGANDKVEAALQEALMLHRNHPGRDDAGLMTTLVYLGRLGFRQGKYDQAELMFRSALETCRRTYSGPHDDTVKILLHYSGFVGNMGDHEKAIELAKEALTMARILHETDHQRVKEALQGLGGQLHDAGHYDAALPRYQEALAMGRRLYAGENIMVAQARVFLGLLRKDMGQYAAAHTHIKEALDMMLRVTGGKQDIRIAAAYHALAKVYSDEGEWTKAETECRRSLAIYLKILERDHLRVARPMSHLGRILVNQNRYAEAEPLLREALAIRQKRKPPGHWKTAKTESVLGACLTGQGRYEEAEPLLLDSYPVIAKDRGPHRRRTAEAIKRIVDLYEAWNKPDRAAEYRAMLPKSTHAESSPQS